MIGMNVIFHLVSAALIGSLVFMWLKMQKQRDFFRLLALAASREPKVPRFRVGQPLIVLAEFCAILQIPLEKLADSGSLPLRIELRPLGELLLRPRPTLLRWKNTEIEMSRGPSSEQEQPKIIEVVASSEAASGWCRGLDEAFGGQIKIVATQA